MRSISGVSENLNGLGKPPRTTCWEYSTTCCNSCVGLCYLLGTCYYWRAIIFDQLNEKQQNHHNNGFG